ncbi:MAG: HlyD family efflux transporter periplasmic adaptor subunit [Alphaproteobacteria bacterium]|nr:HlyD family efflux transporter periplasmic adaptor subunit [Alphaproteobacteria bacterium]
MAVNAKRWAVPVTAAVLLAAGLVYAFWPRPVTVSLAQAMRGEMLVTIEDEGETRVKEAYVISAPLTGRVARFEGKVGDSVIAGETVVATIQPSDPAFHDVRTQSELEAAVKAAEAALDLAKAQVASAEAARDFAVAERKRAEVLAERGTMSKSARDRARMEARTKSAALAEARAAVRVRNFQLENARAALLAPVAGTPGAASPANRATGGPRCCFEVKAPVSGTILRIYRESEAVVQAGAPLVEIGDPKDLEIVTDLLSTDAVLVSPGDPVLIDGWGGEKSLNGKVRRIEPFGFTKTSALGIDEQRVNVIIDFTDPPAAWQRLGHGYRVIARIVRWKGENVLRVPLTALFRSGTDWVLFKLAEGRAVRTTVKVGHINAEWAEIQDGLAEGDTVLLHPSASITEGTRVIPRPER